MSGRQTIAILHTKNRTLFIQPVKIICNTDVVRGLMEDRFRNVGGMDAAVEPTWRYSRRFLKRSSTKTTNYDFNQIIFTGRMNNARVAQNSNQRRFITFSQILNPKKL